MVRGFGIFRIVLAAASAALVLALGILFAACSRISSSSGAADNLTPEFFTREIKGEISVSAYDTMRYRIYLEDAARLFEAQYPGVIVKIETFSAMPDLTEIDFGDGQTATVSVPQDNPQSRADYLNRISTKIMGGAGADIYAMDIIPLYKFIESNTLENLDPYMKNDPGFNRDDFRQNILEALRYRSGIWFLPLAYFFKYYGYDSVLVPSETAALFGADKAFGAEELFRIGLPLFDGTNKLFNMVDHDRWGDGMFLQLLNENIRSFVNLETKQAYFTDGRFSELLESVRKYAEDGIIIQGIGGQQDAAQLMRQISEFRTDRFFFKLNSSLSLIDQFYRSSGMDVWGPGASGGSVIAVEDDDRIAGIAALSDGSVSFRYSHGFGICSQSKNKAAAWAFVKFFLSEDMQLSPTNWSMDYSLNNRAREERLEFIFSGAFMGLPASRLSDSELKGMENYKAAVEKLSDSINTFLIQDTNISDMIAAEVRYYFNGSRTAEETARVLQNKVQLYLGE